MKTLITLLVLTITTTCFSQIVGIDFSTAKTVKTDADIVYEKLLKVDDTYTILYEQNPVGIKHCLEKLGKILVDNDLTEDNILHYDVLLADYVDSITDYSNLCISLMVGESEVNWSWLKGNYIILLTLSKGMYSLLFTKTK